jgi:hypothetical protein
MTSALGLAATSAVLQSLLQRGVDAAESTFLGNVLDEVTVTAVPPDLITLGADQPRRLNIYLYRVAPNAAWSNTGLPWHDSGGDRVGRPPLALDLSYLLTAYGGHDFECEAILGIGMDILYQHPILSRERIQREFSGSAATTLKGKAALAELAEQLESVRICPQTLTTEELSKLWAAFQEKFRPSAAYQVSVVLIEPKQGPRTAPPVQQRKLYVQTFRRPWIDEIEPQMLTYTGMAATIAIVGRDLLTPDAYVQFGNGDRRQPNRAPSRGERLIVPLPVRLPAGVTTIQVVQPLIIGKPEPHAGFDSNPAVFIRRPAISRHIVLGETVDSVTYADGNPPTMTIGFDPDIGRQQRVILLLDELDPPATRSPHAYSFTVPIRDVDPNLPPPDPDPELTIPTPGVESGTFLVRVRVDGAESMLRTNDEGKYVGPIVEVP